MDTTIKANENEKDYSISAVRFFAMCSIVLCHIAQYYGMAIAWWLNIGVQVFFCISGWLYGGKKITRPTTWIWKNYVKILVDVLVFLVVTLPVYYVCADGLTVYDIIKSFLLYSFPTGYAHLWFLPYILLSYLLTPLLQSLWDELESYPRKRNGVIIIFFLSLQIIIPLFLSYFNAPWISCYIIAYYLRKIQIADYAGGGYIIQNITKMYLRIGNRTEPCSIMV